MLKVKFIGAVGTVTGSKTLIEYRHKKYLIDCGLFQGPKEIREKNWQKLEGAEEIKAVILTHAHIDHSGYVPKLILDGFRGAVLCSEGTADLCKILWPDSGYLQEEDARFANFTKHSHHDPALPLYTEKDAQKALKSLNSVKMNTWVSLDQGISFRLIRAGHILGSSIVQINYQVENGTKTITFSGDLGNGRSNIIQDPERISESNYLVMESTYGDRIQDRSDPKVVLGQVINKVFGRGGTLVIPAFSVGRTQELLYLIHTLEKNKVIPPVPVYLDSPMSQDVTELYKKFDDELKLELNGNGFDLVLCPTCYKMTKSTDESMLLCMSDEPKIVISAAGMLTGGRILHHLKTKLPYEKNGVLFVGFQAQGTKGLLLKNGFKKIRIHHKEIDVEAEIFTMESLSAHADSDDIINWMKNFKIAPQTVFLNHGEVNALFSLKYRIVKELQWNAVVPVEGEEFKIE